MAQTPIFHDLLGSPISAGTWVHLADWFHRETPLHASFTWHVEERRAGHLTLVAQEVKKSLPLTAARARGLVAYEPFPGISLKDYPDLWRQFLEAGYGVFLTPAVEGGLVVMAKRKNTSCGVSLDGEEVRQMLATPDGTRAFLVEATECIVHPRRYEAKQKQGL